MAGLERLALREGRTELGVIRRASEGTGASQAQVEAALDSTARRLRELLRLRASPFTVSSHGSLRVDGIAGLLRVSPNLELQVAPKFLDAGDPTWLEDFFWLALFSQTGRILSREQIRAGHGRKGDLASLVGRTLTQLFWESHRRPVRAYRTRRVHEFAYESDIDPVELFVPPPDGFAQPVLQLRRDNEHNAVLAAAARALLPEVRDSETRHQLLRMLQAIGPQPAVQSLRAVRLPNRYRHWQVVYDLSLQVLRGFGMEYLRERLLAPGFVLRTWETWQALVEAALRTGLPAWEIDGQRPFRLGHRTSEPLDVKPDLVISSPGGSVRLVVDAKYRTREGERAAVVAGDVYEALAFLRGTGTSRALLLYPKTSDSAPPKPVGTVEQFEQVDVDDVRVIGLTVECRGISAAGGYERFSTGLASAVEPHITGLLDRGAARDAS